MNSNKIPLETLQCIFSNLATADLCQCQCVCKKWSKPARKFLYESVNLKTPEQAMKYTTTVRNSIDRVGDLVKSINVSKMLSQYRNPDYISLFDCIMQLSPNLKKLDGEHLGPPFWERLLKEVDKPGLVLEDIPREYSNDACEIYFRVALAMRTKLTHVLIYDGQNDYGGSDDATQFTQHPLLTKLDSFSNLKSLKIYIHSDSCIYSFDSYIDKCPLLASLDLTAYPLGTVDHSQYYIDTYRLDDHGIKVDKDAIQPRPAIKEFTGNVVMYTDESIKYFMHRFPQLNSLTLNLETYGDSLTDKLSAYTSIAADVKMQYFKYIMNITRFNVNNISLKNYARFLAKFFEVHEFSGVLDIAYQDNWDDPAWNWYYADSSETIFDPRLQLHNTPDDLYCNQGPKPTISTYFLVDRDKIMDGDDLQELDHLDLIKKTGPFLKHLRLSDFNKKISNLSMPQDEELFEELTDGAHLRFLIKQCPGLKSLTLNNSYLIGHKTYYFSHTSLETLSIGECGVHPQIFTAWSRNFPSLKFLNLSQITIPLPYGLLYKNSFEIDMPYTSFDTIFYYDRARFKEPSLDRGFQIKLETDKAARWFKCDSYRMTMTEITEDGLNNCYLIIKIKCKKLKQLWVQFDENTYHICSFDQIYME